MADKLQISIYKTLKPYTIAIALVAMAVALRAWPLSVLGMKTVWITFYPAIMVAALYGGLPSGLLAALVSIFFVYFGWSTLVNKPVIDGIEATRRIKATALGENMKIIALTAHALDDERKLMLEAGCDDFIRKPFNDSEIFNALAKYIGVAYIYAEEKYTTTKKAGILNEHDLTSLSPKFIRDLIAAVEILDEHNCIQVINSNNNISNDLKICLLTMTANMQYQEMLTNLEQVKSQYL